MTLKIRRDDQISDVDGGVVRARWHYRSTRTSTPSTPPFGTMRVFNDDRLVRAPCGRCTLTATSRG